MLTRIITRVTKKDRVSKSVCGKREGERDKARGERKL